MAFDIKGAHAEGYTDAQIAEHLATLHKFDIAGARNEGYDDAQIADYLAEKSTTLASVKNAAAELIGEDKPVSVMDTPAPTEDRLAAIRSGIQSDASGSVSMPSDRAMDIGVDRALAPKSGIEPDMMAKTSKFIQGSGSPLIAEQDAVTRKPEQVISDAVEQSDRGAAMAAQGETDARTKKQSRHSSTAQAISDAGKGLVAGTLDLGKAYVGFVDSYTGGAMGRVLDDAEYAAGLPEWAKPSQWSKEIRDSYSERTKAANRLKQKTSDSYEAKSKANGDSALEQIRQSAIGGAIGIAENPRSMLTMMAENLPGMLAIAKATSMILGKTAIALDAEVAAGTLTREAANSQLGKLATKYAAMGEGALTAGQVGGQISADNPDATTLERLAGMAAGSITGAISFGVARIPGLGDAEATLATAMMGNKGAGITGSWVGRGAKGVISEGILQEAPQSAQEAVLTNLGTRKPWQRGVGAQTVEGGISGAMLGGVSAVLAGSDGKGAGNEFADAINGAQLNGQSINAAAIDALNPNRNQIYNPTIIPPAPKPNSPLTNAAALAQGGIVTPAAQTVNSPSVPSGAIDASQLLDTPQPEAPTLTRAANIAADQLPQTAETAATSPAELSAASIQTPSAQQSQESGDPAQTAAQPIQPTALEYSDWLASKGIAPSDNAEAQWFAEFKAGKAVQDGAVNVDGNAGLGKGSPASGNYNAGSGGGTVLPGSDVGMDVGSGRAGTGIAGTPLAGDGQHRAMAGGSDAAVNQAQTVDKPAIPAEISQKTDLTAQSEAVSTAPVVGVAETLKPIIEGLIKRRKVAGQFRLAPQLDIAINKAKAAMKSGTGKHSDFTKAAKIFKDKDAEIHSALLSIADTLKPVQAAKKEQKPSHDLIGRIRQLGGIHANYRNDIMPDAPANIRMVFGKNGNSADDMVSMLEQSGFVFDKSQNKPEDQLRDAIQRYAAGERAFKNSQIEALAEQQQADAEYDAMADYAESLGIDWKPLTKAELEDAIYEAEDAARMRALDKADNVDAVDEMFALLDENVDAEASTPEQINAWLEGKDEQEGIEGQAQSAVEEGSGAGGENSVGSQTEPAASEGGSSAENAGEAGSDEFALASYDQAEITRREEAQAAQEAAQRDEESKAMAEQAAKDQADLDARIKARADNPDNFQFGENSKQAAAPVGDLFSQPKQSKSIWNSGTEKAIKLAREEQDHLNKFDLDAEVKSLSEGGNVDLRSIDKNPEFWDAENEELTQAGYEEVDRLTLEQARNNLRLPEINELSDLDSAHQWAQYEAMKALLDGAGIEYQDVSSSQSKYLEVLGIKLRFADHANMVRDSAVRGSLPIINVAPGETKFSEALDRIESAASSISSNLVGTPNNGMQERAVRADKSGSSELAQKSEAGGENNVAHPLETSSAQAGNVKQADAVSDDQLDTDFRLNPERIQKANAKYGAELDYSDRIHTLSVHDDVMERATEGNITADEFKAAFDGLIKNRAGIIAELDAMTKAQIFKRSPGLEYRYKNEKKADVIDAAYRGMLDDFVLSDSISFSMGQKYEDVIRGYVDKTTDESLASYAEQIRKGREERSTRRAEALAGMDNPQTLEDYERLMRAKMAEMGDGTTFGQARMTLTPEQREAYDTLAAEKSRGERMARINADKTEVRAAIHTTTGDIIETKHTRTGEPLFVVKAAERVERDTYNQWNATARRLGGWYSTYSGNGAVRGFQFKTRDNAEAFLKYLGGDVESAKTAVQTRRDVYADDRMQSAAERLTEMADALDDKADEILGAERKVNTARRARFAASAEASANGDKAMAQTMRNIAQAITNGTAKLLDQVRQKVQVEMLQSMVRTAHDDMQRAKYPTYAERERHNGEKPTREVADYAQFPSYSAYRSDLANLGRALLETEGTKKLGQRLMKVADDVTDTYLKFANENLHKVSAFKMRDGGMAVFPSKAAAEQSISVSGYNGAAIVLPFKRGQNMIILSPSEAIKLGVWDGDNDKRITLSGEFGAELVESIGKAGRRGAKISVPWQFENAYDKRKRLAAMGIETPAELRAALREFIGLRQAAKAPDKVKELERAMIGRRNDGLDFFPTPAAVADEMIEAAGIEEGMSVLEPSAGMGHIADRIRAAGAEPDVVELSGDRRELLEAKGYNLVGSDFMDIDPRGFTYGDTFRAPDGKEGIMRGAGGMGSGRVRLVDDNGDMLGYYDRDELVEVRKNGSNSGYDRILMNPPFGDRRDAIHVQHAYDLLKPGGRLVALMGEGVFFGQDSKAQGFRDWLEEVGGTEEKLPDGTFLDPSLPVNTGVAARMVVIEKGAAKYSQSQTQARNPHTLSTLSEAIDKAMGNGFTKLLEDTNKFKLITSEQVGEYLGNSPDIRYSQDGRILAFVIGGQTYLVADNISSTDDNIKGLLHHELGVHALQLGRTDDLFKKILHQFRAMRKIGNQKVKDAYARVPKDTPKHLIDEEALGYFCEKNSELPFTQRMIAAFRELLRKIGSSLPMMQRMKWVQWANKLSENDILHMAAQATRSAPDTLATAQDRGVFKAEDGGQRAESFARLFLDEFVAENDAAFKHRKSSSRDLSTVLAEVAGASYVGDATRTDERDESGADKRYIYTTQTGKEFRVYENDDGRVWIDASRLEKGSGGQSIYAAVANYAYNSRKKFVGDPDGLSNDAVIRRTSNMLSSALQFGTTKHLEPSNQQINATDKKGNKIHGVEPLEWTGSDIDKVEALAHSLVTTTQNLYPEIKRWRYDFDRQTFTDGDGQPVSSAALSALRQDDGRGMDDAPRLGESTARRVVLIQSLISASSEGVGKRSQILEQLLRWGNRPSLQAKGGYPDNLTRLFSKSPTQQQPISGMAQPPAQPPRQNSILRMAKAASMEKDVSLVDKIASAPFKLIQWDKLVALNVDALLERAGEFVPETVKAGMISDYGLESDYIDRKAEMKAAEAAQNRKSAGLVEMLAGLTRAESRVAYNWMQEKPDTVIEQKLLDQLPEQSRETLKSLKQMISDMGKEAVRLGQLSPEAYERNDMAYLNRTYAKHMLKDGKIGKFLRARALRIKGNQYKGRGIFDEVGMDKVGGDKEFWRKTQEGQADKSLVGEKLIRFERRDASTEAMDAFPGMTSKPMGKLREVVYWPASQPIPAKFGDWVNAGTFEVRDTKGGKLVVWRDFTKDERVKMGELDEVRYAVAQTLQMMTHDIEVGRFFSWAAKQYGKPSAEGKEATASESMLRAYGKDEWVQVPSSNIPDTKTKKYGALAGLYVPGAVWNDIRQTAGSRIEPFGHAHEVVLQFWKKSKTAWSPAVHTNNVMANFVIADWHDLRATDLAEALKVWAYNGKDGYREIYQRFEDSGALGGMFLSNEALRDEIAARLEELKADLTGKQETAGEITRMAKVMHLVTMAGMVPVKIVKSAANGMESAYQFEDAIFRLAAFTKAIRYGKSDIEAGRIARHSFLNYDINAPWIQALRHTALPFVSFFYRALPMALDTAKNKPWKILKLLAFYQMINMIGYLGSGGDEDDERKSLPKEKAGRVWGVVPKMVRMPWNHADDAPYFLDIRRFVPVGDVADIEMGSGMLPPWATPGGVIPMLAEVLIANKSFFTEKDITLDTDTQSEKAEKRLDHIFKSMMPNVPLPNPINIQTPAGEINPLGLSQGSLQPYAWSGIERASLKKEGSIGEVRNTPAAIASALGIKVSAFPKQNMEAAQQIKLRNQVQEIKDQIKKIQRNYSNLENPTAAEESRMNSDIDRQMKKIDEVMAGS